MRESWQPHPLDLTLTLLMHPRAALRYKCLNAAAAQNLSAEWQKRQAAMASKQVWGVLVTRPGASPPVTCGTYCKAVPTARHTTHRAV